MKKLVGVIILISLLLSGCSYNYYIGTQLEKQKRYEEAHLAYHKALVRSWFGLYKSDTDRMAKLVSEDMQERYHRYLDNGNYAMAYDVLNRVIELDPENKEIQEEYQKWAHILIAGKLHLSFDHLGRIPVADDMRLEIEINTPQKRVLTSTIDIQNSLFFIEDAIYEMKPEDLLAYTIRSVKLEIQNQALFSRDIVFASFGQAKLVKKQGALVLQPLSTPQIIAKGAIPSTVWSKSIARQVFANQNKYSMAIHNQVVHVSSAQGASYLPAAIYANTKTKQYFISFNSVLVKQNRVKQSEWKVQREKEDEDYISLLKGNYTLLPYLQYTNKPVYIELAN